MRRRRSFRLPTILFAVIVLTLTMGCFRSSSSASGDAGTDTSTDLDSDTDTDTDSDADTDTDTVTDTETDTDTDYCSVYDCWLTEPTGQTECYDDFDPMDCTVFPCNSDGTPSFCGQDAQYPSNLRTFTCYANGVLQDPCDSSADEDESVADSLTGLEWQRVWTADKNWQEAIDYCEALDYASQTDWRLPSYHELAGITTYGTEDPAIDAVAFPGTPSGPMWSSTAFSAFDTNEAWYVDFSTGAVHSYTHPNNYSARCVRGGPSYDASAARYVVTGTVEQEVVLDQATGLEWTKEYEVDVSWQEALAHCEGLDYGGLQDWRLPTVNELRGLVDIDMYDPASSFPETASWTYWSSSTQVGNTARAWSVHFYYGYMDPYPKITTRRAMCVRGGP